MLRAMQDRHGSYVVRIVMYMLLAVLVIHWSTCAWFFEAYLTNSTSFENTWVQRSNFANGTNAEK